MRIFNLIWGNNTSWRWTRDLSAWADQIAAGGIVRMEAAFADGSSYEWASDAASGGQVEIINYAAGKYLGVFKAPLQDLRGKSKIAKYDCRLETTGGARAPMFGGVINVKPGVTTTAADSTSTGVSGIPDTVLVEREVDPAPAIMPLSLTAAIDAAQSAQGAAEAAASAAQGDAQAAHDDRLAADQSASNADGDAQAAHDDRLAADQAKADSEAARDLAQKWATQTTPEVVAGQGYGAKKYAQDAAASEANAAASKSGADAANAAAAGQAAGAANSKAATAAALLQAISYAALAQAGAASVSAQTGLSILAAAQRAIALMTDGSTNFIYNIRLDSDGGAWVDKINNSILTEALNTATRGATAKPPKMMLIVARYTSSANMAIIIYDLTDPTVPMWAVANGIAGGWLEASSSTAVTCLSALNGSIFFGSNAYDFHEWDLIADVSYRNVYALGKQVRSTTFANRNSAGVYTTISTQGIASRAVNSIAATVLPNTPLNPLRCNLPNPTVAVATASGVSVIRSDGVVCNTSAAVAMASVSFDAFGNLWTARNGAFLYIDRPATYMTASWSIGTMASIAQASVGIGGLKAVNASGPVAVVCGDAGLARIKLDPANPAQSLINVKTTTYDTGWMVLGKTVLAMAESSQQLSTISGTPLVDDAMNYADNTALAAGGWVTGAGVTPNGSDVTFQYSGGQVGLNKLVTGLDIGNTYQVLVTLSALIGSPTSSDLQARAGTTTGNGSMGILNQGTPPVGSEYTALTFTANAASAYIGITAQVSGKGATLDRMRVRKVAADRSGSGNHAIPVGVPTRAVVATGADTAGYSGWGVGNYFVAPAIALGTADFEFPVSIVGASITGTQTYLSHGYYTGGAYSGARVLLQSSTSTLTATFHDGTNSATISVASALVAGGNYDLRLIYRSALTRFELWSNNVLIGTAARGSVGSLTNASANVFIGIDPALANPTVSTVILALIRAWTYATTPDQIAFMRADEKARFVAYAQSLLTGANVQGAAYDPDTDTYGAPNSTGGCDVFKGSVRVANDNSVGLTTNGIRETNFADCVIGASTTGANNPFGTIRRADGVPAGVTVACVGRGFINGCGYVDVQISGTPGATGNLLLFAQSYQTGANYGVLSVGAASGQQWTAGLGVALAAGALTNIGNILLSLGGFSSAGGLQEVSYSGTVTPTGAISRPTVTRTLNGGATAQLGLYLTIPLTSGQAVNATLRMYQPNLQTGASEVFRDGFTQSANAKAVAMAQGKVAVVTAAGVDVWIPAADGLRAVNDGIGASKRDFYDPTFALVGPFKTTNTTPLNAIFGCPVREGKSFSFELTIAAVQRDTQVAAAEYRLQGKAVWPIGGTFRVDSGTPELIHRSNAGISVGSAAADTTNKLPYVPLTGLASTELVWSIRTRWFDDLLQMAA